MRSNVVRDPQGFIWLGTVNGLARFDGYSFKDFRNVPDDPHSISSNSIKTLLLDNDHRLWIGTWDTGLSLYDPDRDRFVNFLPRPGDSTWLQGKTIHSMRKDRSGDLWLCMYQGGLVRVEVSKIRKGLPVDSLVRGLRFTSFSLGTLDNSAYDVCQLDDGSILVASDGGLMIVDSTRTKLSRWDLSDPSGRRLNSAIISCLSLDSSGRVWIGTGAQGLYVLDRRDGSVVNFRHKKGDSRTLASDEILDICEDDRGKLWIGTQGGIDLFDTDAAACVPYLTFSRALRGQMLVVRLSIDDSGTLWISIGMSAGFDGVYKLSRKSLRFPHYALRDSIGQPASIGTIEPAGDGTVWLSSLGKVLRLDIARYVVLQAVELSLATAECSLRDRQGNLWYGTWSSGLYLFDPQTGSVNNFGYESRYSIKSPAVSIAQGSADSLWTAGYYYGLMKFDTRSGRFTQVLQANVSHVARTRDGRIWAANERDGLFVHDPASGSTEHFAHNPSDSRSISNNRVCATFEDPAGRIWVGAGNVINLWDPTTRSFSRYPNPLFGTSIYATPIGCDMKGRLWVSYDCGLAFLDPSSGIFTNFDASDGVCGQVMRMMNLEDGRVILVGTSGLNLFHPDSVKADRSAPPLVITRLTVNDRPVDRIQREVGPEPLNLTYTQDVLEFEFAATDIDAAQFVRYQYRLEGHEESWVSPNDRRFVRYTGLQPGQYVFKVKAASLRNEWPDQAIALPISISPPWWQTTWAYSLYVVVLVSIVYGFRRYDRNRLRLKHQLEVQHVEAEKLREMDQLKSRFFANISHEFRTPLTLILGPLENILQESKEEKTKQRVDVTKRSAQKLLGLVNQLLDLSKLEAGKIKLRTCRRNIVRIVKGLAYSFESSAGMRGIQFNAVAEEDEIEVYFDKEKLEKILINLLSNAFKFTPDGGRVEVAVKRNAIPSDKGSTEAVEIKVLDSGIGIPSDQLDKVFDRFYQVDASQTREHEGSGIGLALVKELVELHHGTIQVQSEVGRGTTFTLRLPMGRDHLKEDEIVDLVPGSLSSQAAGQSAVVLAEAGKTIARPDQNVSAPESISRNDNASIILIVEDNADVRQYIRDNLPSSYHVIEACDGVQGIEKAKEVIPDLIISDVMMPKKDGYEVCRTLKLDEKTSHIPIILLTAKAAGENKIEGLEIGADDYLIKPFEPKELLARVKNLIDVRRKLRERFNKGVALKPGEIAVTSIDDAFLRRLMDAVEKEMGNENFSVEDLGRQVGMSRSQLHRKLVALTNQSPSDLIRYIRLHRAMDLLQRNAGTVGEVAYTVGYGDPSHFSRRFHEFFGITPGEVRKRPHSIDNS